MRSRRASGASKVSLGCALTALLEVSHPWGASKRWKGTKRYETVGIHSVVGGMWSLWLIGVQVAPKGEEGTFVAAGAANTDGEVVGRFHNKMDNLKKKRKKVPLMSGEVRF